MDVDQAGEPKIVSNVPSSMSTDLNSELDFENFESQSSYGSSTSKCSELNIFSDIEKSSVKNNSINTVNRISNSDDSFEVFQALKPLNKRNTVKSNSKQIGKQKQKKTINRSRTCPYFSTKGVANYFKSPVKSQEEKDLELALALSLRDISDNNEIPEEINTDLQQKLLVKENPLKLKNWTGKNPKKCSKSLLVRRTPEDREKIITQKVGIVLLETAEVKTVDHYKTKTEFSSSVLEGFLDKESSLWELSKLSNDIFELTQFYVDSLKPYLSLTSLPPTTEEMSDSPEVNNVNTSFEEKPPCDEVLEEPESHKLSPEKAAEPDENEFKTTIETLNNFSDDWLKLFNNKEFSDIKVLLQNNKFIPCHKLVFQIRCPSLMSEINHMLTPDAIDLTQYNPESAMIFLKYIYSGKTDDIKNLEFNARTDFGILATKYNLHLQNCIAPFIDVSSFYSDLTNSPPHGSRECSPDSSGHVVHTKISKSSSLSNKQKITMINEEASTSKNENLKNDDCPVMLISDSSSEADIKPIPATKETSTLENPSSRPFGFLARRSVSPDLFDVSAPSDISLSSQIKRRLSFEDNAVQSKRTSKENNSVDFKSYGTDDNRNSTSPDIVNLDSDSDDVFTERPKVPETELSRKHVHLEDIEVDDRFDNSVHFNFDINEYNNEDASNSNLNSPFSNDTSGIAERQKEKALRSSMDKYLQTSFPSISEDFIGITESKLLNKSTPLPSTAFSISTPLSSPTFNKSTPLPSPALNKIPKRVQDTLTPVQNSSIIIKDATPLADYDAMVTPQLKNELAKYGLKSNLDNKKAKLLLQYIYDQTHPVTSDLPGYKSPIPSTSKDNGRSLSPVVISDGESDSPDESNERDESNEFDLETSIYDSSNLYEPPASQKTNDLKKAVLNFFKSDNNLMKSVLMFEPLLLKKLFHNLKDHGICCKIAELMDVLDDAGVTFRVERAEKKRKKKRKARSKKTTSTT